MKKLFIFLFFLSAKCFSQSQDSIMIRKPVPVEAPIQNLNLKEDKSDRFYVGLVLIGGGIILESIATKEEGNTKSTFEFMGGAFGIFGLGIGMSFTF